MASANPNKKLKSSGDDAPPTAGAPLLSDALVWVDCEMTGLGANGGPGPDALLEVALLITDGELNLVHDEDESPEIVVHQPDGVLDGMNDWCKRQFGWNGAGAAPTPGLLAERVRNSKVSLADADEELAAFVAARVERGKGVLAGNTVHMDKRFLDKYCPRLMAQLHYRLVDVSTVKELTRRWSPEAFAGAPKKKGSHRALDDIKESLEELRYYRGAAFKI